MMVTMVLVKVVLVIDHDSYDGDDDNGGTETIMQDSNFLWDFLFVDDDNDDDDDVCVLMVMVMMTVMNIMTVIIGMIVMKTKSATITTATNALAKLYSTLAKRPSKIGLLEGYILSYYYYSNSRTDQAFVRRTNIPTN